MIIIWIISIIAAIIMVGAILLQSPKSGGAGPMMGGTAQLMGHQRTTDILEKTTWVGISVLFLVCITYGVFQGDVEEAGNSINIEQAKKEKLPAAPAPEQQQAPAPATKP